MSPTEPRVNGRDAMTSAERQAPPTADLRARVEGWLEEQNDQAVTLLRRLVQVQSTQGHEGAAQQIVAEHLRLLGLEVDVCPDFRRS